MDGKLITVELNSSDYAKLSDFQKEMLRVYSENPHCNGPTMFFPMAAYRVREFMETFPSRGPWK